MLHQVLVETELQELSVLFADGWVLTPTGSEHELVCIRTQFVQLVISDVVEGKLLEMLQAAMRVQNDEPIPGGHPRSPGE